jgi:hypothetical protein
MGTAEAHMSSRIRSPGKARTGREAVMLLALLIVGCKGTPADPPGAATSPQAGAEPTPLASLPAIGNAGASPGMGPDAGPAPEPLRSGEALASDLPGEFVREPGGREASRDVRELSGYALQAVVRTGEGPGAPRAPEVNVPVIDGARRKAEARVTIEMVPTRARFILSGGFVLPPATELRGRVDRYGYLLLWPGEATYRIVEPGALRALLGENRLDVAPLSAADVRSMEEGSRRLNARTRRVEVSTRASRAIVELATLRDAGDGGSLVCGFLLDLMSAPPSTPVCGTDEVPVHAELRWTARGALTFDVTSIVRRIDVPVADVSVPPPSSSFAASPPPASPAEMLVSKAELAAFRTVPVDVPVAVRRDVATPSSDVGLLLVNASDELRVAWIDGVPVAWVAPGAQLALPMLLRGRYELQWRTFLGDSWERADTIVVPGTSEVGGPH